MEIFAPAISAYLDREGYQGIKRGCPEEDNYYEMYERLGNPESQEEIRKANPGRKHCLDLQVSPNACVDCKNNILRDRKPEELCDERETLEENVSCLEYMLAMNDYIRMGLIHNLDGLSPEEALALRFTWQQVRSRERADEIEVMAKIYGSGLMGKPGPKR